MRLSKHLRLLIVVTVAWFLFWAAGLPDYYRQYSTTFMLVFDVAVLPILWLALYSSLRKSKRERGLANSLWMAFYVTIPLFIYDLIYCGYYLGYGMNFIWEYWYLTVYYVLPWLILPPTGWWIDQQHKQEMT